MEWYIPYSWKNQYYQNDYTVQGNLQIQCNSYQITKSMSYINRNKKKNFNLYGNPKDPE